MSAARWVQMNASADDTVSQAWAGAGAGAGAIHAVSLRWDGHQYVSWQVDDFCDRFNVTAV